MAYIPDEAIDRSHEITPKAFRLYAFLCRVRNGQTGRCFPSLRVIADSLSIPYSSASELRTQLVEKNWIEFTRNSGKDEYFLTVGFGKVETIRKSRNKVSEKSKFTDPEIRKSRNKVSEKSKLNFGKVEIPPDPPIRSNQQIEPAKEPNLPVTSSPTDSSLPPAAVAQERPARRRDVVFETVTSLCQINLEICTAETRGAANQTAAKIRAAHNGQSDEQIAALIARVGSWWWEHDWRARGPTKRPPKPHELREIWDQAIQGPPQVVVGGVNFSQFAQTAKTAGNDLAVARWLAKHGGESDGAAGQT